MHKHFVDSDIHILNCGQARTSELEMEFFGEIAYLMYQIFRLSHRKRDRDDVSLHGASFKTPNAPLDRPEAAARSAAVKGPCRSDG